MTAIRARLGIFPLGSATLHRTVPPPHDAANYYQGSYMNKFAFIAVVTFAFGALAAWEVPKWEAPKTISVVQLCGKLSKSKTWYDGVQPVFMQTDEKGTNIGTYYLRAVEPSLAKYLDGMAQDKSTNLCVIGLPSQLQMVDSPKPFYALELKPY